MTLVKFKNSNGYPEKGLNKMFSPLLSDAFENFFTNGFVNESINRIPAVNIYETNSDFNLDLAAPGFNKEDFKIHLEKDTLIISGEKKSEKTDEAVLYSKKEFNYSSFKRSFNLPETADREQIKAEYTDGVLSLKIAKKKEALHTVKEIQIA